LGHDGQVIILVVRTGPGDRDSGSNHDFLGRGQRNVGDDNLEGAARPTTSGSLPLCSE
jgi:hypothetical protein